MFLHSLLLSSLLFVPAEAQNVGVPSDLTNLVSRAQEVRSLLAAGQMVEAIEFILPEKRNELLAAGRPMFRNPRILGVDLVDDPSRAVVRVSVQMMPVIQGGDLVDVVARDPWVRVDGQWYFNPTSVGEVMRRQMVGESVTEPVKIDESAVRREFDSLFELKDRFLDVGMLVQGDRKVLSVQIEYSGQFPIRIETPIPSSLLALERESTTDISAGAGSIKAVLDTSGWEGPFRLPLPLKIYYRGTAFDRILTVEGNVFVPLSFDLETRQEGLPDEYFRIRLQNNSDTSVEIQYVTVDGMMDIVDHSTNLEAGGGEGFIDLRILEGVDPPNEVTVVLREPLFGQRFYEFPLNLVPRD